MQRRAAVLGGRLLAVQGQAARGEDDVRVTTAFNRLLRLPGASVIDVGFTPSADLLTKVNRAWVGQAPLPPVAREQITVALAMIVALEQQRAPIDHELRLYARRQTGCRALIATHDGSAR